MSNILITSMGTGAYDPEKKRYEYRNANYSIDGNQEETPYIFHAVYKLRGAFKSQLI